MSVSGKIPCFIFLNDFPTGFIYEDNHLISKNKTRREIVQGDKTGYTTF